MRNKVIVAALLHDIGKLLDPDWGLKTFQRVPVGRGPAVGPGRRPAGRTCGCN